MENQNDKQLESKENSDKPGKIVEISKKINHWIYEAFSDWLSLLQGPDCTAFTNGVVDKEDWSRLFRLLVLAVFLYGIAVGTRYINTDDVSPTAFINAALASPAAMKLVIGAALLTVAYSALASLFRISIHLIKVFFASLFLGLPWLPLLGLVDSIFYKYNAMPMGDIIYVYGPFIFFFLAIKNFAKGVLKIASPQKYLALRVWASILIPILLILIYQGMID